MNAEQVQALLRRVIKKEYDGNLSEFARDRNVNKATVSLFLNNKNQEPGATLLEALGLEEIPQAKKYRRKK